MPQTQLMLRTEDAAKNQTARNPEFTVLHSVERPASEKEMKIVTVSLDDAGRTTNLYRMTLDTAASSLLLSAVRPSGVLLATSSSHLA